LVAENSHKINSIQVSVIIPCFNHGHYIDEAVDSVLSQSFRDFEIIIINDGSTDESTNKLLSDYRKEKTRVIHTSNQGLPAARNNGIKEAKGTYILPLDADDRIGETYLEQAVKILESSPQTGIVYCRANYFGAKNSEWILPDFSLEEMLINNIIFCSALFRRSDWQQVGGYDPAMVYGWEDYDFWLSLIELGRKVKRIPEVLFYYRVNDDSMLRSKEKKQKLDILVKIFHKHEKLFKSHINVFFDHLIDLKGVYYQAELFSVDRNLRNQKKIGSRKVDLTTKKVRIDDVQFSSGPVLLFCPINEKAIIHLGNIRVLKDNREIQINRISSNSTLEHENNSYFNSHQPKIWVYPDLTENENSRFSIEIDIEYLIIGDPVSDHIIKRFEEKLKRGSRIDERINRYIQKRAKEQNQLLLTLKGVVRCLRVAATKAALLLTNKQYRVIALSGQFDRTYYLAENLDVLCGEIDPLVHYCQTGWRERRRPNREFDPDEYLHHLGQSLKKDENPFYHFIVSQK